MKRARLILALWVTILGIAHATTFTVSNTNDSGAGSLRQAILSANADATATAVSPHQINFTVPNGSTITVLSPFLVITNHIRINGLGVANLTISGGGTSRIFWIQNGAITIQNLTLANGYAKGGDGNGGGMGAGGAIFMHEGKEGGTGSINLSLVNVNLSNNRAVGGNASSDEIGGGGLGGNGGVYIRTFPGFILIQGGGGGVLGNGGGAGGSVTNGGDNIGGTNGGISIFGNGGNRGTVAGNGGFGGGGGGGTEAGNGGFGGGGGGGTGGGHGGFGGGGGGGTSGGSGGFGGGGGTGNSISAGGFGGGNAGGGGMGAGGAIFVASGNLGLTGVNFTNNNATRGTGANNGKGYGGALFVFNKADNGGIVAPGTTNNPSVTMCNVTFSGNTADDDNSTYPNNDNVYASNTSSLNPTGYISSNATTICTGGSIQLSFIPNSGTGPFDIVVNGVTYNDVPSGSVFLTRTEGTHFTGTTHFNLTQITDANNCVISGLAQTITINVNTVNAGSISGDQMVCAGGDPGNLTSMTNGSGPGTVTYRWESSTTNCSSGFFPMMGATGGTYDPPAGLSQTTYYRRVTISTLNGVACEAISNCVTITIRNVSGGTVAGTQVVCYGGDPTILSSTGVGSGSGTITYRWESGTTDCNSGFTPIMGATGATYDPPVGITQTTYFRRVTISTLNGFPCEAIAPNCIVIVVLNPQGGTIAGDQAICSGADPAAFTSGVAGSGNAGTITYRWESSTTNCNSGFTPIMGATGLTYDPSAVSQTTYFRRVTIATFNGVANGACEAVSNCVTVTVQDNELPTIVCPTGSTTSFGQSDGNTNFTSISTFQSFTPVSSGDITSITIYLNTASSNLTLQVQSGSTCDGTILGSKTFNGVVGFQTITFDTPIPVTGGIQYNFGIVGTISSAANYTGSYSGGRAYLGGCPGLDMIFQNYDLVFTITMSVPGPVTLNTDPGTCAATYVILDPISDNCTGATWSASFSGNGNGNPANFSNIPDGSNSNSLTFQKGTTNVVLTGMDAVGNLATCSVNVIVTDNQDPTFSCPSNQDVNLNATCQLSVPDLLSGLTGNDNCGTVTFSQSPTAGTLLASSHNQTHTVTITAADGNGNTSTCEVTLTGKDVTDPTITCPATQTLVLGANCTATLPDYTSLATTGDNCGIQSVTQSPTTGMTVSGAGNMTVTLTVTDLNGNETECTFTVTKVDNMAPTITCPTTQTLVLGANCTATLPDYTSLAATGDNCSIQSVTQSPTAGTTVSGAGNMTVTLTVTDLNGNETECTFTVTKVDNTAPTITCPATQTLVLGANCAATLPDYTSLATNADNCGIQSVTQSPTAGMTVSGAGNMTVTLTVTDLNGNETECTFTVTKVDNTAPIISCPATQTLVLGANCAATLPDYTSLATTGDNCGVQSVTQSPKAGTSVSGAGNMTVTLTVTDLNGNETECTFTVTKVDNTPPTVSCPTTQTLVLGVNCTATLPDYTSLATTADNCGVQSVTQSPTAGMTVSGAGNMPVKLTVTDLNDNETECTFTVTKVDNTPPTVSCPTTQTLVLGANCTATLPDYTSLATTADNCGVQSVTQLPTAGTTASGAGNMTVTLTVTDLNGNETECTFTVTKVDNNAPSISCPTTQTLVLGANCTATLPDYTSLATTGDNCGIQSVKQSPTAGTTASGAGNMTVTLTVTDLNGNETECTFTVTKVDNMAPTITCPTTQILVLGANCTATLPDYTSLAATGDNCGIQSVTQSPEAGTSVSGAGNMTVTLTVTDLNGNETECTFTVTKVDNTAPSISCPNTQTLALGANCTATLPDYTSLAATGDNCGIQSVTQSPTAGMTVSGAGNMTVTLTVTDLNGNETECTFTVTKVDQTPPTISCPTTQTLVLGANCTAAFPDYTSLATTGDNCGIQSVKQSPTAGMTVSGAGNMTVTLTVTDLNGNETECTFTVTKVDNTVPSISCPTTQTLVLGANCTAAFPDYTSLATTADNCGVQSVTQSPTAGTSVSGAGNMTVTLTVTDLNGNETECTFTVTKVDNMAPTITCPTTRTLVLGANCTATLPDYTSLATTADNCGIQSVKQSPTAGTTASGAGNMPVTLTVTDLNGNETECTFTVTKVDNTPPTLVCKNTTVFIGNTGTYTLQPADVFNATASSDNCSGVLTVTNISPAMVSCAQLNQIIPVTVTVQDASGNTATCTAQITVQEGSALPLGWSNDNIGNANGTAGYKACSFNGSFTVSANGFSTSSLDVLHFTSQQLCGNGEITVRVMAVSGGGWAGVMMRESLSPVAKKVVLKTQLSSMIRREIRTVQTAPASILNFNRPQHVWLRLVRDGSTFTGYTSLNGTTWSFAFSATVSMAGCIQLGVFSESINANTTTTATFSNISVTGASNSSLANGLPDTQVAAEEDEQVRIFPNPTTGEVTIDLDIYAGKPGTIQVFNALGALTTQERLIPGNPETHQLLLGDIAGVYTVVIQLEDSKIVRRVVVQAE